MSKLPVSVVVPHKLSRSIFFNNYCLPSIELNNPNEIIILSGDEHVQIKRNEGASISNSEFIFFCDDDIILPIKFFERLLSEIGDNDFAYCDYIAANHPNTIFKRHTAKPFDIVTLRQQNYISTMSLVRKSAFPGFDENIERLQDWDMFLTMTEMGSTGVYVQNLDFIAFWLDQGITGNDNWHNANEIVRRKHNL